jgi:hypothetical protein
VTAKPNGWVALAGHIVGSLDKWVTDYSWDRHYYKTKRLAIAAGTHQADGTDDFNVGHVVDGALVWFGWMDKQFTDHEDYAGPAEQWDWTVPDSIEVAQ